MTSPAPPTRQWHDGLLLGHAEMDATHQAFAVCLHALQTAPDGSMEDALQAFERHARAHFGTEDAWMRETAFPARGCHIDEHAAVLASVRGVQRRVALGDFAVGRRLAAELQAWFPAHTQHLDAALSHWLCQRRLGGRPVVLKRRIDAPVWPD
jgi:hemerythrin